MSSIIDRDLLIRVDENIKNLIAEFSRFKDITSGLEVRLRAVEAAIIKLEPIPSVSHEAVVHDIALLTARVDVLYQSQEKVLGGWKTLTFIGGLLVTVVGLVYYVTRTIH